MFHTRAHEKELQILLTVPAGKSDILRLYTIDPDHFMGGRHQEIYVGETLLAEAKDFDDGRWLEASVGLPLTSSDFLLIRVVNRNPRSNAVLSIVEWVEPGQGPQ
ncbi:hypothetical protein [Thermogutta sp.]|uniref:hypothetical protein n=1 Tax=Thermogutta sp. TaxID=1962930 RepID=UPI003C7A3883